jgi:hypothetical protein
MARIPLRITQESCKLQVCGDCTECCTVLAISELDKPIWTNCRHQMKSKEHAGKRGWMDGVGCAIYHTKPTECSTYWCFFSGGMFGSDIKYRPDKLGLIIDFRGVEEDAAERLPIQFLQVWESRPNALKTPRAKEVIDSLGKKFPIVLRGYRLSLSKIQVLGSKDQIKRVVAFLLKDLRESRRQEILQEALDKLDASARM